MRLAIAAAVFGTVLAAASAARTEDRHAGYYYPEPQAVEVYEARAETLPDSNRRRRIACGAISRNRRARGRSHPCVSRWIGHTPDSCRIDEF